MSRSAMLRWIAVAALALVGLTTVGVLLTARAQADDCRSRDAWSCLAPLPTPRSEIQAATTSDRIYVAGGLGLGGRVLDAFEAFDLGSGTWSRVAPLPSPRHHAALAALQGRVYLAGGYETMRFDAGTDAFHVYEPEQDAWRALEPMPGPRAAHVLVAFGDRVWVFGGLGRHATEVWAYDPATDSWETGFPPLPTAREHLAAAAFDGAVWIVAGRWEGANLTAVERFDPETGTWSDGPPLPAARGGLTGAVAGGALHVTGGESLTGGAVFDDHWMLEPGSDAWTEAPPLPRGRHGLASVGVDDRWFVIGGATRAGAQTVVSVVSTMNAYTTGSP